LITLIIIITIITTPEINTAESNVDPSKGTISGKGGLYDGYAQSGRCILNCKKRVPNYTPVTTYVNGPGSTVGIATGYGLNGPGIESR
jgi:hypothetical protein